jgi:hypothetical protein
VLARVKIKKFKKFKKVQRSSKKFKEVQKSSKKFKIVQSSKKFKALSKLGSRLLLLFSRKFWRLPSASKYKFKKFKKVQKSSKKFKKVQKSSKKFKKVQKNSKVKVFMKFAKLPPRRHGLYRLNTIFHFLAFR